MPVCRKCKKDKPEDQFNFFNKEKGTRQTMCRECFSEYNRERYRSNPEKYKADVKKYREENTEACFETRLKVWKKNKTLYNARKLTEAALASGKIKRPETCQVCGKAPEKRIEAHHENYDKPLDIIWCCTKCHDKLDIARRKRENKPYHARVQPVRCVETGEVYDSVAEAARKNGIKNSSSIFSALCGKAKTAGGFHWEKVDRFKETAT